jgi:hypothetical protein
MARFIYSIKTLNKRSIRLNVVNVETQKQLEMVLAPYPIMFNNGFIGGDTRQLATPGKLYVAYVHDQKCRYLGIQEIVNGITSTAVNTRQDLASVLHAIMELCCLQTLEYSK